jgi:hypothetical protein
MGGRNSAAATPVLLNVYDLTGANDYLYWLGFGVFHSGIEGFPGDLPFCFLFFSSRRRFGGLTAPVCRYLISMMLVLE